MFRFAAALAEQTDDAEPLSDNCNDNSHPTDNNRVGELSSSAAPDASLLKPPTAGDESRRPCLRFSKYRDHDGGFFGNQEGWRNISNSVLAKKSLDQKRVPPWQQQEQHHAKSGDSDTDTDGNNDSSRTNSVLNQLKRSSCTIEKASQPSKDTAADFNDAMTTFLKAQTPRSSHLLDADGADVRGENGDEGYSVSKNFKYWPHGSSAKAGNMNFIMLLGLVLGLLISKALQYLQIYFKWFQNQVLQLRIALLGHISIVDFFNFDDTTRFALRTKLLLLPLVGTFSLLYGTIVCLHYLIRFLLTQVPAGLVSFIQKLYTEA